MGTEDKTIVRKVGERIDILCSLEEISTKGLAEGEFSAVITTSAVDRMNESIDTSGISTDNYMKNPVVLYGHDYQSLPIGKTTKLQQFKNKMVGTFQLAIKEYEFAATVAALIKGGYLNAVSIGGIVKEWSPDYSKVLQMEMVEYSVVPVPAHQDAIINGRSLESVSGKKLETIRDEYQNFVGKYLSEKVKTLDNAELINHIKTLKDLTAILETAKTAKTSEKAISDDETITLTIRKTAGKVSETGQQIIRLVKAKKES